MTNTKFTFLYIRLTDKESKTGDSELQGRELAHWCKQNNVKNIRIFADRGASKLTDDREAYARMMEKLAAGECETLLVLSFSRLARSKAELLSILQSVRANAVRFVSLQDNLDSSKAMNILGFLEAMMKMEKEVIGERLQAGRKKPQSNQALGPASL